MQSGERDRLIIVQRSSETRNALNELEKTWTELFKVWANVMPVSDSERFRAGEVVGLITDRFNIRWSLGAATVTRLDRISFDGNLFDIHAIKEVGRHKALEISASAVVR